MVALESKNNMEDVRLNWLSDYLSEPTRKARRGLLLSSGISILLIKGQLVPTKISTLGLSIDQIQKETILQSLIAITVYYFVKFYIYSFIDGEKHLYLNKKIVLGDDLPKNYKDIDEEYLKKTRGTFRETGVKVLVLSLLRTLFDFAVPLVAGVYALYHLTNEF